MLKNIFYVAFMATLSCLSLYSQAATVNADVTIKEIRVVGSGDLIVITNEPLGANCYTSDKQASFYFTYTRRLLVFARLNAQ